MKFLAVDPTVTLLIVFIALAVVVFGILSPSQISVHGHCQIHGFSNA